MKLSIEVQKGTATIVKVGGHLDTNTAPALDEKLGELIPETEDLVLDLDELSYISSAGLRVLLRAQKAMGDKGNLRLVHVHEEIMDVLEVTGFTDFLTIE